MKIFVAAAAAAAFVEGRLKQVAIANELQCKKKYEWITLRPLWLREKGRMRMSIYKFWIDWHQTK